MNMFFGGRLKGMPPKLVSDDGRHVVIRPLAYVAEDDLERWAAHRAFPIIPCTLCGNQENLQRVRIRQMLRDWEREHPGRTDNIFRAMGHVVPSHLADRNLYPFATLQPTGVADAGGDRAFDDEEVCAARRRSAYSIDERVTLMKTGLAKTLMLWLAAIALGGCAAMNRFDSEVAGYSHWPADRRPASYAFERLPSQQARVEQQQRLEEAARPAIEAAGFTRAADPKSADVTVQVGARIARTDRSPFDDPLWWGPGFHRPFRITRAGAASFSDRDGAMAAAVRSITATSARSHCSSATGAAANRSMKPAPPATASRRWSRRPCRPCSGRPCATSPTRRQAAHRLHPARPLSADARRRAQPRPSAARERRSAIHPRKRFEAASRCAGLVMLWMSAAKRQFALTRRSA